MIKEKWFTIPKFELYEMNELLQVRHREKKIIKSCYLSKGYLIVNLQRKGMKKCKRYLHQLVGLTFIPNPENKPELHHIDEDKLNNHWTNLMWVTRQEHRQISKENEQTCHKVSVKDVLSIRWVYTHELKKELANKYGVSQNTIYNIAIGSARKDVGGKIHEPTGCFKKIVNIETGKIINSSDELATILGIKRRYIHRQLSGERYCHIPYRYVGEEDNVIFKPVIEKTVKKNMVAKFTVDGELVDKIDLLTESHVLRHRVGLFLSGRSSSVDGFLYKKIADDGSFIEPPKFIPKPKRIRDGVVPDAKPVIKFSLDGKELNRYPSIKYVADELGGDKHSVRNAIRKSSRNYYKGFIWKYADAV